MITDEIRKELFKLQDKKYRDFQSKLIPNISPLAVIGVRTPELRKLAKKYEKKEDISLFLDGLPHQYFDENQLHAFIISEIKDMIKQDPHHIINCFFKASFITTPFSLFG